MITRRRIRPIIRKELRQIARDRRSLAVLLVVPAVMLIMFGYALNYDVKHVPLAIFDQDNTTTSRELTNGFLHTEYFDKIASLTSERQIELIRDIEKSDFFELLRTHTLMGFLGSPAYGGNRGKVGWKHIHFDDRMAFQPPFGYYDAEAAKGGSK